MKVSNILRYCINVISLIICTLGFFYFVMYYKNESFKTKYEDFDMQIIAITVAAVIITEIANLIIVIAKCGMSDGHYSIKASSKVWMSVFVMTAIASFVYFGDAIGMELGLLFLDFTFFILGDMVEFCEIREVETTYEVFDDD